MNYDGGFGGSGNFGGSGGFGSGDKYWARSISTLAATSHPRP
jgi:hypothetical protein